MSPRNNLSSQEQKVLVSLAAGNLYKEIAIELNISINTVKKHLKNIYRKLEVSNRRLATSAFLQTAQQSDVAQPTAQNNQ